MELSQITTLAMRQAQASVGAEIAVAVVKNALDAKKAEGEAIIQLLDPNAGKNFDRTA